MSKITTTRLLVQQFVQLTTKEASTYSITEPLRNLLTTSSQRATHDDVIKWKHFPRYWLFVRGIHRSRWIPHTQRPVMRSFGVFFKRLSKQPRGWWFETPSLSLWRQCNVKRKTPRCRDHIMCRIYLSASGDRIWNKYTILKASLNAATIVNIFILC